MALLHDAQLTSENVLAPRLSTNGCGLPQRRFGRLGAIRKTSSRPFEVPAECTIDWMERVGRNAKLSVKGAIEVYVANYANGPLVLKFPRGALTWRGYDPALSMRAFACYWVAEEEAKWLLFYGLSGWCCGNCKKSRIYPFKSGASGLAKEIARDNAWVASPEHRRNPFVCPWCKHSDMPPPRITVH